VRTELESCRFPKLLTSMPMGLMGRSTTLDSSLDGPIDDLLHGSQGSPTRAV
jgi:hypothetical protein